MGNIQRIATRYPIALIFVAAMLWASDAPFRVALTQSIASETIVFLEHALALLLLIPLLWRHSWRESVQLSSREWLAVLFIGVGGSALALFLFTQSFHYLNPSTAILLQKLQPLISIGLAAALLKEVTSLRFWLLSGLALAAAYVISFPDLWPRMYDGEVFSPNMIGVGLAFGAALLWGASTVLGKYVLGTVSFSTMTLLRFLVATVFLLLYTAWQGTLSDVVLLSALDWGYVVVISLVSGVTAMCLYYLGLAYAKASAATIAELGFPVAAVMVNYIFLDAALTFSQLLAMLVLLYAVWRLNTYART